MGLLKSIFTWWDGATIGTSLWTRRNGSRVGEDGLGNVYFKAKRAEDGLTRRWVIYNGANDASRVPPEWHSWLHHTIDAPPIDALPPPRSWQKPAVANETGTPQAYRPAGSLDAGGFRQAATGDYEPWSPSEA